MDILQSFSHNVVWFLIVLTIVVFFHELGHYAIARWCGVKVDVFSVGFGPELFGRTDKSGTRWRLSLIPLGGYVKFFGDASVASDRDTGQIENMTSEEKELSFHHKSLMRRAAIVAGGPIANFVLSVIIATGFFMVFGQGVTPAVIGEVMPGSAAETAGLQAGDQVVQIEGKFIDRFEEIPDIVRDKANIPLLMIVKRDEESFELTVTPQQVEVDDALGNATPVGRIGISVPETVMVPLGPLASAVAAVNMTYYIIERSLINMGQIVTGARSAKELGGPIMIAQLSGSMAADGMWSILYLIIIISTTLGLINLFPIPVLDGGHLLFIGLEALRGKPLGERAQGYGMVLGLAMVLTLMVFVTFNDLTRPNTIEFFRNLLG